MSRPERAWRWEVGGRYGYWAVDKYDTQDDGRGTYGDSLTFRTKKDATAAANALNSAFAAGMRWQRQITPIPDIFPVRPLEPDQAATDRVECGECGRAWDDAISTAWTPTPSGRCPFEYWH